MNNDEKIYAIIIGIIFVIVALYYSFIGSMWFNCNKTHGVMLRGLSLSGYVCLKK